MMAQKHLQDLLREDQEPFVLKSYISDKRCQLKRSTPSPKTHLIQLKKRKPISEKPNFSGKNFCKNACLFSFHDSPDVRKSPFFELPSPAKSPCKNSNSVLLHIPARTASVLLEAASRIQKQSSSSTKHKTQSKGPGLALFGSLLKRLTNKNRTPKRKIDGEGVKVSVKDILRWDSSVGRTKFSGEREKVPQNFVGLEEISACEISASELGFSYCSCNGRLSSAVWSENNEERSLDTETSSSGNSDDSEATLCMSEDKENGDFVSSCQTGFCKSPFRFVLQRNQSSGCRTPDFSSPATSPNRHHKEEMENCGGERVAKFQVEEDNVEEEKDQFSPVSVLDPSFEDEDDIHEDDDDNDNGGFDLECSYAFVQRAKQQLLQKLRRFEQLAELDPIELEKRLLEDDQEDEEEEDEEDECKVDESVSFNRSKNADECIVREVLAKLSLKNQWRVPADLKRLVADLIAEEKRGQNGFDDREEVVKRVCKRLESLKEVESNTIDMMVEFDFRRELDGWKRNDQEQVRATAMEIELAIFGLLVEELSEELVC